MKSLFQSLLLLVLVSFFISSFTVKSLNDFTITVKGLENKNLLIEGIKPYEFAEMIVEASDKNMQIRDMEISLARGNRLVSKPSRSVKGNSFDLTEYSSLAKSGDRIAIKLSITIDKENKSPDNKNFYITIPIK